jgi:hypothetical protein
MCKTPWSLAQALRALTATQGQVLEESCLPYSPEAAAGSPSRASKACQRTCNNIAPELTMTGGGTFVQTILPDPVTVQQYIRRVGGVVTRFEVHSDFEDFFKGNATAVYPGPGKNATYMVRRRQALNTGDVLHPAQHALWVHRDETCDLIFMYSHHLVEKLELGPMSCHTILSLPARLPAPGSTPMPWCWWGTTWRAASGSPRTPVSAGSGSSMEGRGVEGQVSRGTRVIIMAATAPPGPCKRLAQALEHTLHAQPLSDLRLLCCCRGSDCRGPRICGWGLLSS